MQATAEFHCRVGGAEHALCYSRWAGNTTSINCKFTLQGAYAWRASRTLVLVPLAATPCSSACGPPSQSPLELDASAWLKRVTCARHTIHQPRPVSAAITARLTPAGHNAPRGAWALTAAASLMPSCKEACQCWMRSTPIGKVFAGRRLPPSIITLLKEPDLGLGGYDIHCVTFGTPFNSSAVVLKKSALAAVNVTTPLAACRCAAVGAGAPVAAPVAGAGAGTATDCRRLLWEAAPSAWHTVISMSLAKGCFSSPHSDLPQDNTNKSARLPSRQEKQAAFTKFLLLGVPPADNTHHWT